MSINYNEQMLNYYPEVIKAFREFQALIASQSVQVEELHAVLTDLLKNAYLESADETAIERWEAILGITPLPQREDSDETYLQDRRETILARLYDHTPLNTASIAKIVKIFTGGDARSEFKDSTIYVYINPPKDGKAYKFDNVVQELQNKLPAHLMLSVQQDYYTWLQTKENYPTWDDLTAVTWNDILYKTLTE